MLPSSSRPLTLHRLVSAEPPTTSPPANALLQACRALLAPLAELAIARGLHYSDLDELLRAAFVE